MGAVKDLIQGRPLGHPSHPLFVHFPIAFYAAVVSFDIMSRLEPNPGLVLAATYLLFGAFAATAAAAFTGFVDWLDMVKGSTKRRRATVHALVQITAAGIFIVNFILRWGDRAAAEADMIWIVLGAIGFGVVSLGNFLGGILVYRFAMRVSTTRAEEPVTPPPG